MGSAAAVAAQPVSEEPPDLETKKTDSIEKSAEEKAVSELAQKTHNASVKPSPFPRKSESRKPESRGRLQPSKQAEKTVVAGALALGFTNRQLIHRIPAKPISTTFNGSIVVMADCGRMAYPTSEKPAADTAQCEPCHAG